MASSLSNLVNNISEEVDKTKCKYGDDDKKCEMCIFTKKNGNWKAQKACN